MKHILLILILSNCIPFLISAQSLGYNNNRIAVSADGNNQADNQHKWTKADPDDYGATPAALAMIAKLKLQDQLVHYSYNNFVDAPPHTSETNQMKLGADGGIKHWNFDADRFFDVSAQYDVALKHLANEISKSSSEDPLYFIHMGPAEFFYRAVKMAIDNGKAEALKHVYVISHSGYNDNHLRRGDPKFDKTPVAEADKHHTMDETIVLSGNRLQYKKIKDQNAGWKSHHDWSVWSWMRDHQDSSVAWVYERMLANRKNSADISDAGMLYYLLLGDEEGNPSKFKKLIGDGITPVKGDSKEKETLLIIEAEQFKLKGQWKLEKDVDKASGGKYIYFDGPNSYKEVNMDNHISYTFRIKDPGDYTVKWMMRQPEGERGTDKGNDAYIYFSDDVAYVKKQKMTHYEKFYSRSGNDFVLHGVAEVHGLGHSWLTAKFPIAGEYTINIVGRSHGIQIDRIILFKVMKIDGVKSILEKVSNL